MKICYTSRKFSNASLQIIEMADEILRSYYAQGYVVTLRQLYYQFVARDLIPNRQSEYKRLGSIINDARLAGLIDWSHMEDRTRNLSRSPSWDTPGDIIESAAAGFRLDPWQKQRHRVEVWVEKEALASVIGQAAEEMRSPYFCCRGYTSQSELYTAAQRLVDYVERDCLRPVVLHLGDHDPSGIDMTRDIVDRLDLFMSHDGVDREEWELHRIALNFDQVEQYNPPPNPAKTTDSRFENYQRTYGVESWELDALDPATLHALIVNRIRDYVDDEEWQEVMEAEEKHRNQLQNASEQWERIAELIDNSEL